MEKFKDFVRFFCEMAATKGGHLIGLNGAVLLGALLALMHVPKAEDMMLGAFMAWLVKLKE